MDQLAQQIESLIFCADGPLPLEEISACLEEAFGMKFLDEELLNTIRQLRERYSDDTFSFELVEIAGGYQFLTKGAYHPIVGAYLRQTMRRRLSGSALETLAIVAYKQPVSKSDLEKIRGVNCDYALQKLLEKELVSIMGRSDGPGRPLLYGTSPRFMDYFGLKSMEDLPKPKEFKLTENAIGEQAPIEENLATARKEEEE